MTESGTSDFMYPGISYIESKGLPIKKLLELALREGNSKFPVYRMHKWWARRLGSVVRAMLLGMLLPENISEDIYWDIYTGRSELSSYIRQGQYTILDPFMGGGSSLVEAFRLNLSCTGFDIDPMAWFITRQELSTADLSTLEEAFEQVERVAQPKISKYYKTINELGEERDVVYYFWVRTTTCPTCRETIELHPHYQLRRDRKKLTQTCFCSKCHKIHEIPISNETLICDNCGTLTSIQKGNIDRRRLYCPYCDSAWPRSYLRERPEHGDLKLFALQYIEEISPKRVAKRFKTADKLDQELFISAESVFTVASVVLPAFQRILNTKIPTEGREDPRPINYGMELYSELFNARQLLCLFIILGEILTVKNNDLQEALLLAFSDSLACNNMMCYYAFDYDKVTPLFGLHGYNMVTRPVENNVWGAILGRGTFKNCYTKLVKGLNDIQGCLTHFTMDSDAKITYNNLKATTNTNTSSSTSMLPKTASIDLRRASAHKSELTENSIDVILTDPPYFDNLNYGELSDFYYSWLRPILNERYPQEFEPLNCVEIIERIHGNGDPESINNFREGLTKVFLECRRVLKKTGIMALTFHHKREEPWLALSEALHNAGFTIVQIVPVRSEGRSGFHSAPGNIKWDAIIVCRPSVFLSGLYKEQRFNTQLQLENWKQELTGVDGGPSEEDWHSLELALKYLYDYTDSPKNKLQIGD